MPLRNLPTLMSFWNSKPERSRRTSRSVEGGAFVGGEPTAGRLAQCWAGLSHPAVQSSDEFGLVDVAAFDQFPVGEDNRLHGEAVLLVDPAIVLS